MEELGVLQGGLLSLVEFLLKQGDFIGIVLKIFPLILICLNILVLELLHLSLQHLYFLVIIGGLEDLVESVGQVEEILLQFLIKEFQLINPLFGGDQVAVFTLLL